MINPKLIGALYKETASDIARVLGYSGIELLKNSPLILSTLNSQVVKLVLSNPRLPLPSCLLFFNFLRQNPSNKPDLVAHLTLIRNKRWTEAHKLRDRMEAMGNISNAYTYVPLIRAELLSGNSAKALQLFNEMKQRGIIPNGVTYTTVISSLSKQGRPDEVLRLHDEMIEAGITPKD
ncbi:hypothetical protein Dsin_023890 [Dipteronia sinensis]|uniref:Pentatricopeptide repeat-containing protein n=1 Tax=Dipteronia sinensis TaxID=43782 RepID=A0AAE0A475_9ROSI|nr:hypothetical protein Dsin_023890 [Dipteronia sinensis]